MDKHSQPTRIEFKNTYRIRKIFRALSAVNKVCSKSNTLTMDLNEDGFFLSTENSLIESQFFVDKKFCNKFELNGNGKLKIHIPDILDILKNKEIEFIEFSGEKIIFYNKIREEIFEYKILD